MATTEWYKKVTAIHSYIRIIQLAIRQGNSYKYLLDKLYELEDRVKVTNIGDRMCVEFPLKANGEETPPGSMAYLYAADVAVCTFPNGGRKVVKDRDSETPYWLTQFMEIT